MTDGSPPLRVRAVPTSFGAVSAGRQALGRFNTIDRAATVRQAAHRFARLGVSTADIDQFTF